MHAQNSDKRTRASWPGLMTGPVLARTTVGAVVALLAWGVFALASVPAWAYTPLFIGAAVLGAAGLALPGCGTRDWRLIVLLTLVAAAASLQLVPLPQWLIRGVSPGTHRFFEAFLLGYGVSGDVWRPLSIHPPDTLYAVLQFLAFAVLAVGVSRALTSAGAGFLARGVAGVGLVVALTGLAQDQMFDGRLLWIWPFTYEHRPFGTFVNKNNYAGWMLLAIPLTVGLATGLARRGLHRVPRGWRNQILWLASPAASEAVVHAGIALVMTVALIMTMSRSGMLGLCCGVFVLAWLFFRSLGRRTHAAIGAFSLVALVVGASFWVGFDRLAARFDDRAGASLAGRMGAWQDALGILRDFPVTGTGLNTFGTAMLLYQQHDPYNYWNLAHNDYLQVATEGGLLVGIPALIAGVTLVRRIRAQMRHDDLSSTTAWVRIGAVCALVAIGVQELVEFSLQVPGNAVLLAVVLGVALHTPHAGSAASAVTAPAHDEARPSHS